VTDDRLDRDLASLGVLGDPVRRALYLHVVRAPDTVGRDQAAVAVGISRSLAAFHLDRLVEEGLLEADFRRLSGRAGPGAGRPSKVYRRRREIAVSVPRRDYELAARLLMGAIRPGHPGLGEAAHREGRALGEAARRGMRGRRTRRALSAAAVGLLEDRGFHPFLRPDGTIRLGNCPFDALAADHADTICRLNLAFLRGVIEGLGIDHLEAEPRPRNGACCVALERTPG
jgi:predicted ArsR family transcriptional regulator